MIVRTVEIMNLVLIVKHVNLKKHVKKVKKLLQKIKHKTMNVKIVKMMNLVLMVKHVNLKNQNVKKGKN